MIDVPDGSQRALAEGTLALWLRTGDGCHLDNADADTLREICRILTERADLPPEGHTFNDFEMRQKYIKDAAERGRHGAATITAMVAVTNLEVSALRYLQEARG